MKSIKVEDSTALPCCGCDGKAIFTPECERPTFFHTIPYCKRFDEVNTPEQLIEYWRECAEKVNTN